MTNDKRWLQRFDNFQKAFLFLQDACQQKNYSLLETIGLVKTFKFTFELGWKTLKDYLYEKGVDTKYPSETIKHASKTYLIEDELMWMEMLNIRNEFSYNLMEEKAKNTADIICKKYFSAIAQAYEKLKELTAS